MTTTTTSTARRTTGRHRRPARLQAASTGARRAGLVLLATGALSGLALAPAHAAPPSGGPSTSASCVGQVFVPQATSGPRTVSDRIHVIMDVLLPEGDSFGTAISGLAHDPCDY